MQNKKAQSGLGNGKALLILGLIMIIIMIGILVVVPIYYQNQFPKQAEEKCEKLDMELFDYSIGNLFTDSSITCWNPETKETRVIK